MQILYDITNDNIFDAPRLLGAFAGVIFCVVFLVFLISERKNFAERSRFVFLFLFLSLITAFQTVGLTAEWFEYQNNYYLSEYLSGNTEVIEGTVKFAETPDENSLHFFVDGVYFDVISNGYNNRGYHSEDYNNSFKTNDFIKVYYIKKQNQTYHNYSDTVIVRIEKQVKQTNQSGDGSVIDKK